MVTRFYFPAAGGAPVSPAHGSSPWNKTAGAARLPLLRSSTETPRLWLANNENAAADPYFVLIAEWVSEPLDGAALAGTFDFVMPAYENSSNANIFLTVRVSVVSEDGNTLRGVLYTGTLATELPQTAAANATTRILTAAAITGLDPSPRDRLVVQVGFETDHSSSSTTLFSAGIGAGDATSLTDYALTSGTAAGTGRAWIEFSQTLGFLEESGWVDATVAQSATSVATYNAQTWTVDCLVPVEVASYEADVAIAGTYVFSIDGVDQATVVVPAPATARVMFACPAPVALTRGPHEFKLRHLSGATLSSWYHNDIGNYSTATGEAIQGAGQEAISWGHWIENEAAGGTVRGPGGTVTLRTDVNSKSVGLASSLLSGGVFSSQTWSVSLNADLELYALVFPLNTDNKTWELLVDGVVVDTATKPSSDPAVVQAKVFYPLTPLPLAAGSHTYQVRPTPTATTLVPYRAGSANSPAGSGSVYLSAWSAWSEQSGNQVPARFVFARPIPDEPIDLSETHTAYTIDLSWDPPTTGVAPDGYQVRIDGGTAIDVATALTYPWTGLAPETEYTVEVRAYTDGGFSSWVGLPVTTDPAPVASLDYQATIMIGGIGGLVWVSEFGGPTTFTIGEDPVVGLRPEYGPLLPIAISWGVPDPHALDKGFPQQPTPTVARFSVLMEDLTFLADVVPGHNGNATRVEIHILPHPGAAYEVATFDGHLSSARARPHHLGMVVDFTAVDDTADGPRVEQDSFGADWGTTTDPLAARLDRIDHFLDIDLSDLFPTIDGVTPTSNTEYVTVPAASTPDMIDYTTALRFLSQATIVWDFGPGNERHGKPILAPVNDPLGNKVRVVSLPQYPKEVRAVPASVVPRKDTSWVRVKTGERVQWVFVQPGEGLASDHRFEFDNPNGAVVYVTAGDLAAGGTAAFGISDLATFVADAWAFDEDESRWAPDPMRILGWRDPELVAGFFDADAQRLALSVNGLDPRWEPGDPTPSGMLAGVSFVLPPGGKYYADVQLRRRVHTTPT